MTLAPFFLSLLYVALRATQQLNVVFHRVVWIIPVSYGMALCDVMLVGFIAVAAVKAVSFWEKAWLIFQIGTGGAVGAIASMVLHKKMRKK